MGPKGGRPTASDQLDIVKKIKPYFEMGVSAQFTAGQPNMPSVKTIQNYFRNWKEQHLREATPSISARQQEVKAQFVASYDKLIFNLNVQFNEIVGLKQKHLKDYDDTIEKLKGEKKDPSTYPKFKLDPFLENKYTNLCKLLGDMVSAKASAEVAPYAHEVTYEAVLHEMQAKYEKTIKDKPKKEGKKNHK